MKIIGVVGSRDLNERELKEVEQTVVGLMNSGHTIITDGSKTVGLKVMETAYRIDPSRLFVYLHCKIERNPKVTHNILNKLDPDHVLTIQGPYNNRNIFKRNKMLVEKCDLVVAFWKSKSPGTQHIIKCCKNNKPNPVPVYLIEY